ncbi:hypothetical protein D3C72_1296140 [compost metagenome]
MPMAIGRSKTGPSFLMSAGAMLMVMRRGANSKAELRTAERTRSFDSLTAESGSPTIAHDGTPFAMSTSTSTW